MTGALSASLDRRLGPLDGAVIVVSNVIGVGIFTTPGFVATLLPNKAAMLAVWAIGGALAFAGAFAYAELAARRPQAGGEYVYLRESFGGLAAFLAGWTSFVAGFSGAIAAGAVGATAYLDQFIPGAGDSAAWLAWHLGPLGVTVSNRSLIAIAIIMAFALVHACGLGPGRLVLTALTMLKVGGLVTFVVVGLSVAGPYASAAAPPPAPAPWTTWLIALVPVMFSYSGWNAAVYIAEEIRYPARNLPVALGLGTATVVGLYLALNGLYLLVVPHDQLVGQIGVGELAAGRLFGSVAASAFAAMAIVIILSSLSAMTLAGPRVYFAMARDGAFLPAAGRVHPRYRTPVVAIFAQAGWSALLVLSSTFEQLLTYTGFSIILFSALAVLSLFFVRHRSAARSERALTGPCATVAGQGSAEATTFRAWGYPWTPALFCMVSFAIVISVIVEAPRVAFAGLGVMAAGVPVYWWMRSRSVTTLNSHKGHEGRV
jgi:APA family basic amino acid/polyamine antiporter